jgi:hypothetical protein
MSLLMTAARASDSYLRPVNAPENQWHAQSIEEIRGVPQVVWQSRRP